jgi:hypothetical protein
VELWEVFGFLEFISFHVYLSLPVAGACYMSGGLKMLETTFLDPEEAFGEWLVTS